MNGKRQAIVSSHDAKAIESILSQGKAAKATQVYYRALLRLGRGETMQEIADDLGVSRKTISNWKKRYQTFGLDTSKRAGKRYPSPIALQASIAFHTNQALYNDQPLTAAELAKRVGANIEKVEEVWKKLGFPAPPSGETMASPADASLQPPETPVNETGDGQPLVRLADIAGEAGVSISTVSRALKGDPKISPYTTQRVRAISSRKGYSPDPILTALVERRWKHRKPERLVAFLLEGSKTEQKDPLQCHPNKELWKGFSQQANRLGFKAKIYYSGDYPNYQSLARVLYNRGIEGVAIGYVEHEADDIEYKNLIACLTQRQFSLVSASWRYTIRGCPHIFPGAIPTWDTLVERLEKRRRRRIGITVKERWQPLAALSTRYAQLRENATVTPIMDEGSFRKFEEEMGRSDLDLVIGNDWHYDWLLEMGYSIPRDTRFVSREKIDLSDRRIAGIDPRMEDHGAECARYLDLLIRNHIRGLNKIAPQVHLTPRWIKGDSLPED